MIKSVTIPMGTYVYYCLLILLLHPPLDLSDFAATEVPVPLSERRCEDLKPPGCEHVFFSKSRSHGKKTIFSWEINGKFMGNQWKLNSWDMAVDFQFLFPFH
jgi:hypothetical protein